MDWLKGICDPGFGVEKGCDKRLSFAAVTTERTYNITGVKRILVKAVMQFDDTRTN